MKIWAYREAELLRRQQQQMAASRLRVIDGDGRRDLDRRWSAKFAELLSAQGSSVPAPHHERDTAYSAAQPRAKTATS
jgi:hypothetical protein